VSLARCWQSGLQGPSVRRGRGCPTQGMAGSSGPAAGHSRAPQPGWWHLRERRFRRGQKMLDRLRRRGKKARISPASTWVRE